MRTKRGKSLEIIFMNFYNILHEFNLRKIAFTYGQTAMNYSFIKLRFKHPVTNVLSSITYHKAKSSYIFNFSIFT